jgi:uncharacterized protein (TIGR00730 family)
LDFFIHFIQLYLLNFTSKHTSMKSILVYCGANEGNKSIYKETAAQLGKTLAEKNIRLIYGGGSIGLMGAVADGVLQNGGDVLGIIPNFIDSWEVGHKGLPEMIKVETMHERKALMEKVTDGIIVLPGGYGTFDEMFEILAWSQLKLHSKPVGLLNVDGFYDHLLMFLDKVVADGFLRQDNRDLLLVADTIEDLMEKIMNFKKGENELYVK